MRVGVHLLGGDGVGGSARRFHCRLFRKGEGLPISHIARMYHSPFLGKPAARQTLAKTMIQGLKTVIWCCSNYRQPKSGQDAAAVAAAATAATAAAGSGSGAAGGASAPAVPPQAVTRRPMTAEERDHTAKFFKWALPCLRVFPKSGGLASSGESKEALDAFAGAFTVLGPYDLRTAVSTFFFFFSI